MPGVIALKRRFRGDGTQTAKPSAVRSQRLCLRPPSVPLSWAAVVGRRTGGEVMVMRFLHLRPPHFRSAKGGTPSPTGEDYRSHEGIFAASQFLRLLIVHEKRASTGTVSRPGSALVFTQLPFRGRAATTLPDAGGSEAAVRKCCEVSSCLQGAKRRPRRRCKGRGQVPRTSPRLPPVMAEGGIAWSFF